MRKVSTFLFIIAIFIFSFFWFSMDTQAVSYPNLTLEFEEADQSVIVAGVPAYDSTGATRYEIQGNLKYGEEKVESFTYAPEVMPYHIPEKQAYIFNWADAEFLLPCSGEYVFTAWVVARDANNGFAKIGTSPAVSITFTYIKADESTNWGPGLPNTTVEAYDIGEIQGKDQTIVIEEEGYIWTIAGTDVEVVPEENISLKITENPENLNGQDVEAFFGETIAAKFAIDYSGEFGFKAVLDYMLGMQYADQYANLFYVAGEGVFEYVEGVVVDENGIASFAFTHASDYVIAVTDEPYTGQELNPKEEESVAEEEMSSAESEDALVENQSDGVLMEEDETLDEAGDLEAAETMGDNVAEDNNDSMLWWIIGGVVVIAVVVAGVVMIKKNKK